MDDTTMTPKTPRELARIELDKRYGAGTRFASPDRFGLTGFLRAQAETGIAEADVIAMIEATIEADRKQR